LDIRVDLEKGWGMAWSAIYQQMTKSYLDTNVKGYNRRLRDNLEWNLYARVEERPPQIARVRIKRKASHTKSERPNMRNFQKVAQITIGGTRNPLILWDCYKPTKFMFDGCTRWLKQNAEHNNSPHPGM